MRILVVEHIGFLRHKFQSWLTDAGHQVESAGNGLDALKLMRSGHFQVVVTGLELPGLDGIELFLEAQTIQHRGALGQPLRSQFVLMTTKHPPKDSTLQHQLRAQEARDVGFEAQLVKPIERQRFVEAIQSVDRTRQNNEVQPRGERPSLVIMLKEIRKLSGDLANAGRSADLWDVHQLLEKLCESEEPAATE